MGSDIESQPLSMILGQMLGSKRAFTDIHVESNQAIMIRRSAGNWEPAVDGGGQRVFVSHDKIMAFVNAIYAGEEKVRAPQSQPRQWERELEASGSLHPAGVLYSEGEAPHAARSYRVRCTIQRQGMGEAIGLVIRLIRDVPQSIDSLGLPIQLSRMLRDTTHGLIVVTGATGSGKSTTIAAMLQEVNRAKHCNILTIEDPIEFEFERDKSIFNQREVYVDVPSFERGVRDALRFVPDVIMVGETRNAETMRAVLRAAESGHIVLTSMHAPTTTAALRKMVSYLDNAADIQALGGCLVGVLAQSLVRPVEQGGACALAYELLNCQDPVAQSILLSPGSHFDVKSIESKLRARQIEGSTPLVDSLRILVKNGRISPKMAASVAHDPEDRAEFMRMAVERP